VLIATYTPSTSKTTIDLARLRDLADACVDEIRFRSAAGYDDRRARRVITGLINETARFVKLDWSPSDQVTLTTRLLEAANEIADPF